EETALAAMRAIVTAEVERLTALRAALWVEVDEPLRAEALDLVLIDESAAGALRRRYETASDLSLHRGLKALAKGRAQREQAERSAGRIRLGDRWGTPAEFHAALAREPAPATAHPAA